MYIPVPGSAHRSRLLLLLATVERPLSPTHPSHAQKETCSHREIRSTNYVVFMLDVGHNTLLMLFSSLT